MTLAIPVVCVIMMSMLRVIAAVVAAEIDPASRTESMPLWQPGGLHIDDGDKYQSECTQHMCTFLLGNKGAHVSNGNVMSFGIIEKGIRISSWNINPTKCVN